MQVPSFASIRLIGGAPVSYFGWIPESMMTAGQRATHGLLVGAMPAFTIMGSYRVESRKIALYDARRKISGGDTPYIKQLTGSCVGAGGGNAILTLRDVEIAIKNENERPGQIFWPYTYGESRQIAGLNGRGEGSFGSAWAKAVTTKGVVPAENTGVPQYSVDRGWLILSQSIEMEWSDGQKDPQKYDAFAKQHLVQTAAPCRSPEDIAAAIQNGYPCTIACMFGTRGPKIQGTPQVAVAEWDDQWAHQQSIDGWWDHPQLGELFHIMNQWGDVHGQQPDGAPLGGYWIHKATMGRICQDRQSEIYALSGFNGFPGRTLPSEWHF